MSAKKIKTSTNAPQMETENIGTSPEKKMVENGQNMRSFYSFSPAIRESVMIDIMETTKKINPK